MRPPHAVAHAAPCLPQIAKIQREHDAREVELRKAIEHFESVKKSAGPSAECDLASHCLYFTCVTRDLDVCARCTGLCVRIF